MASFFSKKSLNKPARDKSVIRQWIGRFFISLGVVMFLSMVISFMSIVSFMSGEGAEFKPLPSSFVLVETLHGARADVNNVNPLVAQFVSQKTSLYGILKSLHAAKTDDRVTHFVLKISDGDHSLTQIQTLREAIIDFRAGGKKAIIYADNYGGFSNGMGEYWLASAFDEIWLNPLGILSLNGIRVEQPFVKEALNKIGVTMEMEQRKAYKTGPEMYVRDDMSQANRETTQAIIDDVMDVMMNDIAAARGMSKTNLKLFMDQSPLGAEDIETTAFIDRVGFLDDLEDELKGGSDRDDLFVSLSRYRHEVGASGVGDVQTALIMIEGAILDADMMVKANAPWAFMMPDEIADAKVIANAIKDAADNDDIKTIILRINSPGGAPATSETIRRAIVKAKEKGKYVIASMADTAASGGYWIAVDADEIIASDLTITGSIGVYGGKPDLSDMWDKIGVNWQVMEYGQNAGMWSPHKGMSKTEKKRFAVMMDHTYDAFIKRVSQGRGMTMDQVEQVAQGRAWTGLDAVENGLVDYVGGLDVALQRATEKNGGTDWTQENIIVLPKDDDPYDDFIDLLGLPSVSITMPQALIPFIHHDVIVSAPRSSLQF